MDINKEYYKFFPRLWDDIEVGELLGAGSFGNVYGLRNVITMELTNEAMKEIVVPPASVGGNDEAFFQGLSLDDISYYFEEMKKKALDEVEIMKQFSNCPNIVQVNSFQVRELPQESNEYGWVIFVRMERLKSFKEKIYQEGMTILQVAELGIDMCNALEACQKAGILHRDIKPENIFYSEQTKKFKLGDFGIACFVSRLTEEKGLQGTLTHMSPEVYRGQPFDYESDLYAVGMVLYKLLNENRVSFLPDYPERYSPVMRNQAIRRRLEGEEVALPSIARKLDKEKHLFIRAEGVSDKNIITIAKIVTKAVSAKREDRYFSPKELKEALQAWYRKVIDQEVHHEG